MKTQGWISVKDRIPKEDLEVIVLVDDIHCGSNYKIAFGHIVDKERCIDYNGWKLNGLMYLSNLL